METNTGTKMEILNTQFFFRDIFELDLQIGFEVFDTRMEAPCVIPTGGISLSVTEV